MLDAVSEDADAQGSSHNADREAIGVDGFARGAQLILGLKTFQPALRGGGFTWGLR